MIRGRGASQMRSVRVYTTTDAFDKPLDIDDPEQSGVESSVGHFSSPLDLLALDDDEPSDPEPELDRTASPLTPSIPRR